MKYKLIDRTPEEMQCIIGGCPQIYEECVLGGCPTIIDKDDGNYYIVGIQVEPKDFGLEKKVGEGEVLIKVPKGLIDNLKRK